MKKIDIGDMLESEKDAAIEAADRFVEAFDARFLSENQAEALAAYRKARACEERCESPTCALPRGHQGSHAGGGQGAGAGGIRIVTGSFVGTATSGRTRYPWDGGDADGAKGGQGGGGLILFATFEQFLSSMPGLTPEMGRAMYDAAQGGTRRHELDADALAALALKFPPD